MLRSLKIFNSGILAFNGRNSFPVPFSIYSRYSQYTYSLYDSPYMNAIYYDFFMRMDVMQFHICILEVMGDGVLNDLYGIFLWWKGSTCLLISGDHKGWLYNVNKVPRVTNLFENIVIDNELTIKDNTLKRIYYMWDLHANKARCTSQKTTLHNL